ncbi:MAG: hypothetical protein QOI71_538, partial [Gaiellales bacterium]|nr:hypothetical protein [Gaiellales bacterium]
GRRSGPGVRGLRPSCRSDLDDAVLERVAHEMGAGGEPELVEDMAAVGLDRAHAELVVVFPQRGREPSRMSGTGRVAKLGT